MDDKVYIVIRGERYEGYRILGIYKTRVKAMRKRRYYIRKEKLIDNDYIYCNVVEHKIVD